MHTGELNRQINSPAASERACTRTTTYDTKLTIPFGSFERHRPRIPGPFLDCTEDRQLSDQRTRSATRAKTRVHRPDRLCFLESLFKNYDVLVMEIRHERIGVAIRENPFVPLIQNRYAFEG